MISKLALNNYISVRSKNFDYFYYFWKKFVKTFKQV